MTFSKTEDTGIRNEALDRTAWRTCSGQGSG